MNELIGFAAAFAGSFLVGQVNKVTSHLDDTIQNAIKPFKPALVFGLAVGLPVLANAVGVAEVPSADVFANAPLATLAAITGREVLRRIRPKGR